MAESTLYASRMGGVTPQSFAQMMQGLPTGPVQPRVAPSMIPRNKPSDLMQGNTPLVNGPNIQPDIPQDQQPQQQPLTSNDNLQGIQVPGPAAPDLSQNPDQGDVGPKLPTTPPKMPKDPTNGVKAYTPEHIDAGSQAITYGFQNNLPQPQSDVQAATQAQDHDKLQNDLKLIAGSSNPKKAWQQVQQAPFYKNSNFYTGMMNVGLAIMSGANPMQAFQAGQSALDKGSMSEQLGANRQALIDQGYSPASVEAAVTSGDASKLQMQQMSDQDRMQAENANWAGKQQYAQDLNQQQTQQSNNEWDRRNAITNQQETQRAQSAQADADKRFAQRLEMQKQNQKEMVDYRNQAKAQAAQQKAASYDFDSRTINAELKAPEGKSVNQWSVKLNSFDVANNDLAQAHQAVKQGNSQQARSAYMQGLLNVVRGEVGDRTIQIDDLTHFGGDPSWFVKKGNEWSMKAGAAPTEDALNYLQDQVKTGQTSANAQVQKLKEQRIRALSRTMEPRRATALVNRAYGGGWHDPLGAFDTDNTSGPSASQGALGGSGGDDLNGF